MRWQLPTLCAVVIICVSAPTIAPYNPMRTNPSAQLESPSLQHILGTDLLGRDVFSRLLYGGQRTLLVAIFSSAIAISLGAGIGVLPSVLNENMDRALTIFTNVLIAFPNIVLGLIIFTLLGAGLISLILATGFTQIATFAHSTRAEIVRIRSTTYITAGYAIGATRWDIVRFYIVPNIQPALLTYSAITFSYCLLNSAALSFLGLGGEPGIPDWGIMLAEARVVFNQAPWIAIAPGLAITIIVWAINSLIDERRLPIQALSL